MTTVAVMKIDGIVSNVIDRIIPCKPKEETLSGDDEDAVLSIGDTKRTFLGCKSPSSKSASQEIHNI